MILKHVCDPSHLEGLLNYALLGSTSRNLESVVLRLILRSSIKFPGNTADEGPRTIEDNSYVFWAPGEAITGGSQLSCGFWLKNISLEYVNRRNKREEDWAI